MFITFCVTATIHDLILLSRGRGLWALAPLFIVFLLSLLLRYVSVTSTQALRVLVLVLVDNWEPSAPIARPLTDHLWRNWGVLA